ncbi:MULTISPECIES: bifunctional 4-hydroxy-2-oxoglutarate aldolase/2-dehydro-3-deoxy-phosphogluconate aldolase [Weissella]|uniref:4-Hydroxy-2-oxoglutarate aldolase / 2-dehydro-3-deoxyphosphogluconate aldolase n=2 Tax=Weissella TaxID=46255 RepID=A0A1L6RAS3_9LACO|nr:MULTISPECIES: bifunctional 4-hydroxy-2-oxoglutarate aldolase/2-dehydro-3-deoxy-phosphogluconate aldolase [Weissella]APS41598.1 4-Hydroxy-2-oxoglutarate aldolase / 2-dehydro-3-deoxyphosphogluconate aldolase [Weissella jogaejeotgali]NKY91245.1 bifunctional 4-hydroxy-2-oxoglutarate aldolase/2-dehydro-3-deoxy-phosphogluconate aldolase [Weissella thailandensis]RDS59253.1 bifunctional 4-hydroxy-2-oxoglutarate aldolase/2-dehydro-3-deoxy-phosphogluconate aldolase [Weissella thailandensis]GEP74739.1 
MQKVDTLSRLGNAGVISVVRGETKEMAYKTALACIKGGVKAIELTFTAPSADELIKQINAEFSDDPEVIVGAGTVLDAITARVAIMAGAKFIVSPAFDRETAFICNEYQIPYLPGCMTINEIKTALRYGADIVKVFPGSSVGKNFVKAIKAPLPFVNVMPTGGVNLDNMHEWFDLGVVAVGAGNDLTGAASIGDFESVTNRAKDYHKVYLQIKN